jgi:Tol biopolymer transport system component
MLDELNAKLIADTGTSPANPFFSPDGKRIAFWSYRQGKYSTYWKSADGAGQDELLRDEGLVPSSWANNGKTLIAMSWHMGWMSGIGMLSME